MSNIIVGVGDLKTSNSRDSIVKTYALGSCVGLVILAPKKNAVGLLHIALSESSINPDLAIRKPGMFADTGIPILINEMKKLGCTASEFIIKIAGGANIVDPTNHFEIGKKNILAVKKYLWKYRLGPIAEDVGRDISRTVTIEVNSCKVTISSPGRGEWEI